MNLRPIQLMAFIMLFAVAAIGFIELTDYSSRPGVSGDVPRDLGGVGLSDVSLSHIYSPDNTRPDDATAGRLSLQGNPCLLVFYHPQCPCTAATVRVLERLQARCSPPPSITAIAFCPEEQEDGWIESRTTEALSRLHRTRILVDRGGRLSDRFGVAVSGHILLYNADRQLSFSGGITPYRGHEGDSPSSLDLLDRINHPKADCKDWPVFGCSMRPPPGDD